MSEEHWTARHGKPIIFVILTLVAVGVYLASTIPVAVFPEVDFPRVLVGIDKYADKQILPRTTAEADAQALYDVFTSQDYLGVDTKHVRLLLGKEDKKRGAEIATKVNVPTGESQGIESSGSSSHSQTFPDIW